jgi:hypothetical protein
MSHTLEIQEIRNLTHDVKQIRVAKPEDYSYTPGQATLVAVDREGWTDEKHPFTFTSLNSDPYLEFVIKIYPEHEGVTDQIGQLEEGDSLIIGKPWGTIEYKGEGVFLAGGAGVTPFIAILRDLHARDEIGNNRLIFSNKAERDIILRDEFEAMLGDRFVNVITQEKPSGDHIFLDGRIDKVFLESHIEDVSQAFYVCGPKGFNKSIMSALEDMGANPDELVFEK